MTLLVQGALDSYKAGDSDVARLCNLEMTPEEKDEYLTAVLEIDSIRSG